MLTPSRTGSAFGLDHWTLTLQTIRQLAEDRQASCGFHAYLQDWEKKSKADHDAVWLKHDRLRKEFVIHLCFCL
jgi:hypothetical protein